MSRLPSLLAATIIALCFIPAVALADCGDGNVEPAEECDDGGTVGGDCCSATCFFEPVGSACADGLTVRR